MQTSRGKFDNLRRTPAEFTAPGFDGYGLCYLLPTRPAETASYSVSVRQVTALLDASFEPCLTAAPLRFANTSPPSGCVEDFHLQVAKHARHTIKGLYSKLHRPCKAAISNQVHQPIIRARIVLRASIASILHNP